ncbi:hypothetical protein IEQ44_13135 [Nocardioides sp. Y6]|uniref:Uncharacterized protein n=1 Tax=Nocardioides malaquae TaxID=2773426 RepID=A0ABR9RVL1_9ACTN|nr:hypothetical protein [Nocardioides malaquae]MBE7325596.1 hypothetical protein [Nocardioides malaquae]
MSEQTSSPDVHPAWAGLLDDARATTPQGTVSPELLAQHADLRAGGLIGTLAVRDTDLPLLRGVTTPLRVVLTSGAGAVAGALGLAAKLGLTVTSLQVALRDVDDLGGNARRVVAAVDAARGEGVLDDEVRVHVDVPTDLPGGVGGQWARAADEVAAAELALHLRCDGTVDVRPDEAARWIDAVLDRETPFSVAAAADVSDPAGAGDGTGLMGAVNLLLATRQAFDGADRATVTATLAGDDPTEVLTVARGEEYLAATRRWLPSVVASDPAAVADGLLATGLPTGS